MPHKPIPPGHFPVELREYTMMDTVKRELMMDYESCDLWINREDGSKISISKSIFDSIIASRSQNGKMETMPEAEVPLIKDRDFNSMYFSIIKAKEKT